MELIILAGLYREMLSVVKMNCSELIGSAVTVMKNFLFPLRSRLHLYSFAVFNTALGVERQLHGGRNDDPRN